MCISNFLFLHTPLKVRGCFCSSKPFLEHTHKEVPTSPRRELFLLSGNCVQGREWQEAGLLGWLVIHIQSAEAGVSD